MGLLRRADTGDAFPLGARVLVGRASGSLLRIRSRFVSNEHAVLWWDQGQWWAKDLGSSNGTTLDDDALSPGHAVTVPEGGRIGFGDPANTWVLADARGPLPLAFDDTGAVCTGDGGILCLPNESTLSAMVYEGADGGWRLESEDGTRRVASAEAVAVDGAAWTLFLPDPHEQTWTRDQLTLSIGSVALQFGVSLDEEHVELTVHGPHHTLPVPTRTHHYLLLTLARARVADAAHPAAEQGWRHAEDLAADVGIDRHNLDVQVYRARRQLGKAGVRGAAGLIERRPGTQMLRIGVARLEIGAL